MTQDTAQTAPWARRASLLAIAGTVTWLLSLLIPMPTDDLTATVARLVTLGPLLMVPLGLSLLPQTPQTPMPWMYRAAIMLQWPCAALALGSFYLPQGIAAGAMAVPWLGVTGLLALTGLDRLRQHKLGNLAELCATSALLYIPVGAVWWIAHRLNIELMGFDLMIVVLTAAHFHYAGFTAPLIAGLVGRALPPQRPLASKLYLITGVAVVAGPPLIAIGITISPLLEVVCSFILAAGLLVMSAVMMFFVAPRQSSPVAWVLVCVSALSLLLTMALACLYAWGEYTGHKIILIPRMAQVHGLVNVFGFSLCGLLGLRLGAPTQEEK